MKSIKRYDEESINYQHIDTTEIGWDKELIIAQQEKAILREQFRLAVKLNLPDLEEKRTALMKNTLRVQDIKAMIYFNSIYPGKNMKQIVQLMIQEQKNTSKFNGHGK